MDHVSFVRTESDRFRAALAGADPAAPVPSCPDWTAADLLWHLTEVQAFWAEVVGRRLQQPDDAVRPERPVEWDELMRLSEQTTNTLVATLSDTPPDTPVWSWADDHTAGFSRRRQAHEALIHRLDAELIIGEPTALDATLAADGIGEMFEHMVGGAPAWADVHEGAGPITVRATDTGDSWLVQPARFSGTSPNTGTVYADEPLLRLVDGRTPCAEVAGRAEDLDAWLWGRRTVDVLQRRGDMSALQGLADVVARGVG